MLDTVEINTLIRIYCNMLVYAIPIAFVFGMADIIVSTFLTAALGGGLRLGGKR